MVVVLFGHRLVGDENTFTVSQVKIVDGHLQMIMYGTTGVSVPRDEDFLARFFGFSPPVAVVGTGSS